MGCRSTAVVPTLFPSSNSVEPQRGTASSSVLQCDNNSSSSSFPLQSQRGMFTFFQLNKNAIYLSL